MLYLNGNALHSPQLTIFPDNTSQVWKLEGFPFDGEKIHIEWDFDREGEFLHLAQLVKLLKDDCEPSEITLEITYLPYARQDKPISNTMTFALRAFAPLLNSLKFDEVIIHDPHSELALRLIENSKAVYPTKLVEQVAQSMDKNGNLTIFCYPDKGALTKYSKVYEQSYRPHIYGEKVRDQATGNILSYQLFGTCVDRNVLIVDDICDGGATFKLLAKDLLSAGAKEVNLFVTHGIFSRGIKTLLDSGIKRVFTAKGEAFNGPDGITVYNRWED